MKYILGLLVFLATAVPGSADTIADANGAYAKGDFATARSIAEDLAKAGDSGAMSLLAKIADAGDAPAQLALALIYLRDR